MLAGVVGRFGCLLVLLGELVAAGVVERFFFIFIPVKCCLLMICCILNEVSVSPW